MKNNIYMITVFEKCEPDDRFLVDTGSTRIVGYKHTFEEAKAVVETNMCDIWETCYDYAVIESVEPSVYPLCKPRWFFKYNVDKKIYEPIEEPIEFKHVSNIGIG